jgi:hypothetical protein
MVTGCIVVIAGIIVAQRVTPLGPCGIQTATMSGPYSGGHGLLTFEAGTRMVRPGPGCCPVESSIFWSLRTGQSLGELQGVL